ncbi:phytanoyl-CoA dioxygenase family protein [Pontibacter chinhatensis]|uniref:Predicted DNA-binding transcriptional regulator YafY, contains an HTH and WYL domains n=1 Tax=Pontibacter chinhatensis TaxID=1436961 RepID=A0A1I2Z363_9BACT|nr:WYL domain-containing protein [Pontibacter chinhatensis]SFH32348.1 Predicted DNA-binding transcriptional regulator YafY, contains an HTH and WYL domains [Pontibacter chinhatensis]
MPVNRNALIRYRTLDNCLRNKYRKWTLEDLIDACSEALYEYEGIDKGVSRRTVQMDLQMMRSDKLGYNAPIIVIDKKYYAYEDPEYSITNIPLTEQDLGKLTEVAGILRQFKGFTHFHELNGMVQRLEDRIHTAKTKQAPVIDLEKNEHLKGLEHIDALYQSIIKKRTVLLTYQSFKAKESQAFTFHPYFLKEYRNRWFVLGIRKRSQPVLLLALDRILEVGESHEPYLENEGLSLSEYFQHVVGVSVNPNDGPEEVELFVNRENAPYVLTKPLHHSQQLVEQVGNGIIIRLQVQLNFELEREILGFGDCVKVLKPYKLKRRIHEKMRNAAEQYDKELNLSELEHSITKVKRRGYAVLENIYTTKEVGRILSTITRATESEERFRRSEDVFAIRGLLQEVPNLRQLLFNSNLCTLIREGFGADYFLTKAIYFDKPPKSNWYVTWHQDVPINVKEKVEAAGFSGWTNKAGLVSVRPPLEYLQSAFTVRIHLDDTDEENGALRIIPKTNFGILTDGEIAELRETAESKCCKVRKGGVHLMKPLTLHASSKTENNKHRRVIHLEFNNRELPEGLEWLELEAVPGNSLFANHVLDETTRG